MRFRLNARTRAVLFLSTAAAFERLALTAALPLVRECVEENLAWEGELADLYYRVLHVVPAILAVLGGWFADRSARYASRSALGLVCLANGYGVLILFPRMSQTPFAVLALVSIGSGLFLPNLYALVGRQRPKQTGESERDLLILFVAGAIGWHLGAIFGSSLPVQALMAGVPIALLVALGLVTAASKESDASSEWFALLAQDKRDTREHIRLALMLCVGGFCFGIGVQQHFTVVLANAAWKHPSFGIATLLAFAPLAWFARRIMNKASRLLTGFGCAVCALLTLSAASIGGERSPSWLFGLSTALISAAELLLIPLLLSLIVRLTPSAHTATMVGVWLALAAVATRTASVLNALGTLLSMPAYLYALAVVMACAGGGIYRKIRFL